MRRPIIKRSTFNDMFAGAQARALRPCQCMSATQPRPLRWGFEFTSAHVYENALILFDEFFNLGPTFSYLDFRPLALDNLGYVFSNSDN